MFRSLLLVVVNNTTSNEGLSSQGRMDVFCLFSQPSARTMFVIMENFSFTGFNSRAQPPQFCGDMTGRYYSVATDSGRGATRQLVTEGGTGECQSKRLGDPPQLNITPLRNKKFFIPCGTSYSLYRVPQSQPHSDALPRDTPLYRWTPTLRFPLRTRSLGGVMARVPSIRPASS